MMSTEDCRDFGHSLQSTSHSFPKGQQICGGSNCRFFGAATLTASSDVGVTVLLSGFDSARQLMANSRQRCGAAKAALDNDLARCLKDTSAHSFVG